MVFYLDTKRKEARKQGRKMNELGMNMRERMINMLELIHVGGYNAW
jgi:hypothetical protein